MPQRPCGHPLDGPSRPTLRGHFVIAADGIQRLIRIVDRLRELTQHLLQSTEDALGMMLAILQTRQRAERKLRHGVRHVSSVSSRCARDLNSGVQTELPTISTEGTTGTPELARSSSPHANPKEAQASIKETRCSKSWKKEDQRNT